MHQVLLSCARALRSQLHWRMLMLTFLPFVLSVALVGVLLWLGLQPLMDTLHAYFSDYDAFRYSGSALGWFGFDALKALIVPLLAMWTMLPLMIITALVLIGLIAMPAVVKHVGKRHYPQLERHDGGTLWGSVWISLSSFAIFAVAWVGTLPLGLLPPVLLGVQALLWGWLTSRVMVYDALSSHATQQERELIRKRHYWPLLIIGVAGGALGTMPTLFWLGGVLSFVFLPLLAVVSIWLYVLVFVFTGLWFTYYCLQALSQLRQSGENGSASPRLADAS